MPYRPLSVFLCHASQDKPIVRELYKSLSAAQWLDPWLDEEKLLPGQDFDLEITKAIHDTDVIIICLSQLSVVKDGYVNKEIRRALDVAEEKSEGTIYIIPLRLDECEPKFDLLKKLHWADYFNAASHEKLIKALRFRANTLGIDTSEQSELPKSSTQLDAISDLYQFIEIPVVGNYCVEYPFWVGKYPVTNLQYERFLKDPDFSNSIYWLDFPKFDMDCSLIGDWGEAGKKFLKDELKKLNSKVLLPRFWQHKDFGIANPHYPVVGISWFEACAYCEWLFRNWDQLPEGRDNPHLRPRQVRLPVELEWVKAAGGDVPELRYPWDQPGKETKSLKVILERANVEENGYGHTTPVNKYPLGKSPYDVMDMAGNVWEWQANFYIKDFEWLAFRGGSWYHNQFEDRLTGRQYFHISRPNKAWNDYGFRVIAINK